MPEDYGDWSSPEKICKHRRRIKTKQTWIIGVNVLLEITGWVTKDDFGRPAYVARIVFGELITSHGTLQVGPKFTLPIKWFNVGKHGLRRLETPVILD